MNNQSATDQIKSLSDSLTKVMVERARLKDALEQNTRQMESLSAALQGVEIATKSFEELTQEQPEE